MDYFLQIFNTTGIFIILALSLNVINGFCGQFSLGHAGFFAIGAYAASFLSTEIQHTYVLSPIILLLLSCLFSFFMATVLGLIVAIPALRLKGDYLAITTLGFSEIVRIAIINSESLGGSRGFVGIPRLSNSFWIYATVFLTIIVLYRLKKSKLGRAWQAISDDEIAAENMGISLFKYKLIAFLIGSSIAGVAGAHFAFLQQFIHPSNFSFMWSVIILTMAILGGLGSISGPIIGAIILTIIPEILRFFGSEISELRMVLYSLLLIFLMLKKPKGLLGDREIWELTFFKTFFQKEKKNA